MQQSDLKTEPPAADESVGQAEQSWHDELLAELERTHQLATQVSSWSGDFLSLAYLELKLALSNLPKMAGLALALVPLTGLTWVTLSLLLAWLAYAATGIATVGFAVLFLLQLGVLLTCVWRLKRLKRQASLPETRQQWQLFVEELKQSRQASPRENTTENRH